MAVVVEVLVPRASRAEFDRLDVSLLGAMEQAGGPPAGLMSHLVRQSGEGFLVCDVWRSAEDFEAFYDQVLLPAFLDAGFAADDPVVSAAWSFARP